MKRTNWFPTLVAALIAPMGALLMAQLAPLHLQFKYDGGTDPDKWKPVGVTVGIGTISDERSLEDPMVVGECEANGPAVPVQSLTPVPDFVKEALQVSLSKWKVNVSPDADRVLRCEVLQFWVLEKKRFAAQVRFHFVLADRGGAVLFEGEVANDDSTWGKTCNEKNYVQVLSLATQRALVDLFNNKDFRTALTGKAG